MQDSILVSVNYANLYSSWIVVVACCSYKRKYSYKKNVQVVQGGSILNLKVIVQWSYKENILRIKKG